MLYILHTIKTKFLFFLALMYMLGILFICQKLYQTIDEHLTGTLTSFLFSANILKYKLFITIYVTTADAKLYDIKKNL